MKLEPTFTDHRQCNALTELVRLSRDRLGAHGSVRAYTSGQLIYAVGDATDHLSLVLSGRVRTSVLSPDGRELVLGVHGPGELFGELCFCEVRARQEQAVALEETVVVRLGADDLVRATTASPAGALELLELYCHRMATLQQQLVELAFANVRTRLGLLLLRLAERGTPAEDGGRIAAENLTHEEIATRISTTREQVTLLLTELRSEGAVQYRRAGPMRIYPDRLRSLLERR